MVKSFWGKLETEMVYHVWFKATAEARAAFESIERFITASNCRPRWTTRAPKRSRLVVLGESPSTETG
mgnify:CR=1 FL=1